jgi:hypothetical protein
MSVLAAGRRLPGVATRIGIAESVVFVVAFVIRASLVLAGGGYRGSFGYDASVYYAAGDALTYGRLPYLDYTFLHPPGVALVTAPFAGMGHLIGDHKGFVLTCLAFTALGAAGAALVVKIAKQLELGTVAAAVGGLAYAAWPGSAASEYLCRLEPLGNFLVLLGLLYFFRAGASPRRSAIVCGIALAGAVSVKLWWLVPFAVVLLAHLGRSRRATRRPFIAAAAGTFVLVNGPFFVAAPRNMTRMLLVDQADRPSRHPALYRLANITGASPVLGAFSSTTTHVLAVCCVLIVAAFALVTLRVPSGWVISAILVLEFAALLDAPPYYEYYNDYLAPELALGVAVAVALATRRGAAARARQSGTLVLSGAVAAAVAVGAVANLGTIVTPYPAAALARGVKDVRCVVSNNPTALILLDTLSRGLANGCPNYIDIEGRRYDVDRPPGGRVTTSEGSRWQRDLYRYLLSGDALVLYPASERGLSPKLRRVLSEQPVLARSGPFRVYDTSHLPHAKIGGP